MNDEPDLELEAASAAVDGLATADERALVEASPALRADVELFTTISERIKDVVVPSEARAAALAAALAAFDDLAVAEDAPAAMPLAASSATVVSLTDRRRRQYRVLLGAAAAVAVLGVGAIAWNGRGSDDESSSSATVAAGTFSESSPAGTAAPSERDEDSTSEKAETAAEAEAADAATELPAPAPPADAGDTVADSTPLVISGSAEVTPSIETPEELLAFATTGLVTGAPAPDATEAASAETSTADTAAAATTAADAPGTTGVVLDPLAGCAADDTEFVGTVLYQGVLAHVVRVLRTGEVRALSTTDCDLIVSAMP